MYSKVFKVNEVNLGNPYHVDGKSKSINHENIEIEEEESGDIKEDIDSILENAKKEAEKIIKEAKLNSEKIIDDGKKQIEIIKKKEIEKAKKEGYEAGVKNGYKEQESNIKKAEKTKKEIDNLYENTVKGLENKIIDLVINVAESLLNYEMQRSKDYIKFRIQKILEKTKDRESLYIRVSEEDFEFLNENKKDLFDVTSEMKKLEILKDENLSKGDCIVENQYGVINSILREQFELVRNSFNNLLKQREQS